MFSLKLLIGWLYYLLARWLMERWADPRLRWMMIVDCAIGWTPPDGCESVIIADQSTFGVYVIARYRGRHMRVELVAGDGTIECDRVWWCLDQAVAEMLDRPLSGSPRAWAPSDIDLGPIEIYMPGGRAVDCDEPPVEC